jgi:outer membrane protein OmpA-like peptidoglycan-associated protein
VKNYQVSISRAQAAREWLHTQHGVPREQVVIRGYGEAFPEFPEEQNLKNRRLTFDFAPANAQDNVF